MLTRARRSIFRLGLILLTIILGLGSRRFGRSLPDFVAAYAGDTLWALAAFLGFGLVLPGASTRAVGTTALAFSFLIELSQVYHAPWLDSIRQTRLGGLILGQGFVASDLACYTLGVGVGVALERGIALFRDSGQPPSAMGVSGPGVAIEPAGGVGSSGGRPRAR